MTVNSFKLLRPVPENMVMKMQTKLAMVNKNGMATQIKRPAPILIMFVSVSQMKRDGVVVVEGVCENLDIQLRC